jgi:hypothetical protein
MSKALGKSQAGGATLLPGCRAVVHPWSFHAFHVQALALLLW